MSLHKEESSKSVPSREASRIKFLRADHLQKTLFCKSSYVVPIKPLCLSVEGPNAPQCKLGLRVISGKLLVVVVVEPAAPLTLGPDVVAAPASDSSAMLMDDNDDVVLCVGLLCRVDSGVVFVFVCTVPGQSANMDTDTGRPVRLVGDAGRALGVIGDNGRACELNACLFDISGPVRNASRRAQAISSTMQLYPVPFMREYNCNGHNQNSVYRAKNSRPASKLTISHSTVPSSG